MQDEEMLLLGGLALLVLTQRGKAAAAPVGPAPPGAPKLPPAAPKPPAAKAPAKPTAPARLAAVRIPKLKARANQAAARSWIPDLMKAGATQAEAVGLSRWIGIESSGVPVASSVIGERGLLQVTGTTRKEIPFTDKEWAAMASKATPRAEHARLAMKQYAAHVRRAGIVGPPARPPADALWYGKANHTRPADLRGTTMRPDAATAAKFAATKATTDEEKIRLAVANMVAFGEVFAPGQSPDWWK